MSPFQKTFSRKATRADGDLALIYVIACSCRIILHSSDAHYLGDILEAEETVTLEERSVEAFLDYLCTGSRE